MPNLFANVINNDAIDKLSPAQADAVLAIFEKRPTFNTTTTYAAGAEVTTIRRNTPNQEA